MQKSFKLSTKSAFKRLTVVAQNGIIYKLVEMWGCSSAGRAPALQAGGQRFDPAHLHHIEA